MQRLKFSSDGGSAAIELVAFSALLLLPSMWFSIDVISRQNDQFAANSIAEYALRAWVLADQPNSQNFEIAIKQIATDFHEAPKSVSWKVDCAGIDPCMPKGQVLRLRVTVNQASALVAMRWSK